MCNNKMKLKKIICAIGNVLILFFFGVFIFVATILLINNRTSNDRRKNKVTEEDGLFLDYSKTLLEPYIGNGGIIIYVETEPCASCSEGAIMSAVYSIQDSCVDINPTLIYHPVEEIDSGIIREYYKKFGKSTKVIVSRSDSIMIKNPWMPRFLGFYGIVTDSLNQVCYAGLLFDEDFIRCCKNRFGKKDEVML